MIDQDTKKQWYEDARNYLKAHNADGASFADHVMTLCNELDRIESAQTKLERANAGHHTLEDTQVEIIHDLQEKLQQANAKAGHHALGDVQIENIADDYENAYRFVADERDALQTRIDAMLTKIEDERKASVIRYRGFPNAISTAIERLDAIANAGEESTK